MTKRHPTCHKCGAGTVAMYQKTEYLQCGTQVESIICHLCGTRIAMREINGSSPRRTLSTEPTPTAKTRDENGSTNRPKGYVVNRPVYTLVPCLVKGCQNKVAQEKTKTGLCRRHGAMWRRWQEGQRTTQPPLIKKAKHYIEHPNRATQGRSACGRSSE